MSFQGFIKKIETAATLNAFNFVNSAPTSAKLVGYRNGKLVVRSGSNFSFVQPKKTNQLGDQIPITRDLEIES